MTLLPMKTADTSTAVPVMSLKTEISNPIADYWAR